MTKIFINPGHCPGIDPGAVNPKTGLQEAQVVKNIGRYVGEILQGAGYHTKVVQKDSLLEVCAQCNNWGADLFVSIHCNGFYSPSANGTEIFYHQGSVKGKKLANLINNQIIRDIVINDKLIANRGVKEDSMGLAVLKGTNCPAVLVETAFITNPDEEIYLGAEMGQYFFAEAISRGIMDYCA